MNNIKFSVTGNQLKITQDTITTEGSVNYDGCDFTFDESWKGFTKTAVFSTNNDKCYRVSLSNDSCKIPSVCLEKEGILRIGVFGVSNDDVIITTNSVAHHIGEGIPMTGEWMEEDNAIVLNAVKELQKAAMQFTVNLAKKYTEEMEAYKTEVDNYNTAGYLPDWYLPSAFDDEGSVASLAEDGTYEDYLNFRLEPLREDFPDYVTREELGTDTDGENMIYAYSFTPPKYEKTILITACVHGAEESTILAASHFLDCLCREYRTDNVLRMLHQSVKIVFIPALNPYGLTNKNVYNKNGVNIGCNFPYKWSECRLQQKGAEAGDQTETQVMIEFLKTLKDDKLCAAIELHTSNLCYAGRSIYYTMGHKNCVTALAEFINNFNYDYDYVDYTQEAVLAPSNNAYLSDYISETYGINSVQLIWTTNLYGGSFTNYCISKFTEFIGNAVDVLAKNSRFLPKRKPQPFVKCISWRKSSDDDVFTVTSTDSLEKVPISAYSLKPDSPYNMVLNGFVELQIESECTVKINPVLYQDYSTDQTYLKKSEDSCFIRELTLTAGTHVIPICNVLQAFYTSFNFTNESRYCGNVGFVLTLSASVANKVKVSSFFAVINATPSDCDRPVEVSSPIGLSADYTSGSTPTQKIIFPLGTNGKYENTYYN